MVVGVLGQELGVKGRGCGDFHAKATRSSSEF